MWLSSAALYFSFFIHQKNNYMENYISTGAASSIYPGAYVPVFDAEDVAEELKYYPETDEELMQLKMDDLADCCIIEAVIPGIQREDFLLYTDGNVLSVCMLHDDSEIIEGVNFQLFKHRCKCFARKIILPENADTEFISAEYKSGILKLYVPKTNEPVKSLHSTVVVY
jgi:HSP20 family protein